MRRLDTLQVYFKKTQALSKKRLGRRGQTKLESVKDESMRGMKEAKWPSVE